MKRAKQIKVGCILFLMGLFIVSGAVRFGIAETFFGEAPTGLLELKDYKYPVFLYVPKSYTPAKPYAFIMTVPGEGEDPDKNIAFWKGIGKRRSMLVMAPHNMWPEDLPYHMDQWLFNVKKDISSVYRLAPHRKYVIGKDEGAHYALYLGTTYPQEFSGVAVLGVDAWTGRFEPLLKPKSDPNEQLPILMVLKSDQGDKAKSAKKKAYEFESKGYPIEILQLEKGQKFSDYGVKKQIIEWLDDKSEKWTRVVEEKNKTLKQKFKNWFQDHFLVV